MPIHYNEVVKTVVFDVIETADDGLVYRLEILKTPNGFKGELFRLDTYSLQCSFVRYRPDESIYVIDGHSHSINLDVRTFQSPQECIDFVAKSLEEKLSINHQNT